MRASPPRSDPARAQGRYTPLAKRYTPRYTPPLMSQAPKCKTCGKREWGHVCLGSTAAVVENPADDDPGSGQPASQVDPGSDSRVERGNRNAGIRARLAAAPASGASGPRQGRGQGDAAVGPSAGRRSRRRQPGARPTVARAPRALSPTATPNSADVRPEPLRGGEPAPWLAEIGVCPSCDRRRASGIVANKATRERRAKEKAAE